MNHVASGFIVFMNAKLAPVMRFFYRGFLSSDPPKAACKCFLNLARPLSSKFGSTTEIGPNFGIPRSSVVYFYARPTPLDISSMIHRGVKDFPSLLGSNRF